jgi:predicted peptidase
MKNIIISILLLSSFSALSKTQVEDWVIKLHEACEIDGEKYRLLRPWDYDEKKSYPVIVSLHGAGGRGDDNIRQLRKWNQYLAEQQVRKDYPCYVVAPQTSERWDASSLKTIKAIISSLESVDMNRIYITGFSMGGHGTYILTQLDPEYFAAAAPAAGTGLKSTPDFIDVNKIKRIPFWAFHGDKDPKCPIEKQHKVFEEMKAVGGNMKFTVWDGDKHSGKTGLKTVAGGDNGSTQMSSKRCDPEPVFMNWLFAQKKSMN